MKIGVEDLFQIEWSGIASEKVTCSMRPEGLNGVSYEMQGEECSMQRKNMGKIPKPGKNLAYIKK